MIVVSTGKAAEQSGAEQSRPCSGGEKDRVDPA